MSNPSEQEKPLYAYSKINEAYLSAVNLPDVHRTEYYSGSGNMPGVNGCTYAYPARYDAAEKAMGEICTDMRLDEEQALFVVGTARLVNIGSIRRNAEQALDSKGLSEQRRGTAKFIISQIDNLWKIYMQYLSTDGEFLIGKEWDELNQLDCVLREMTVLPPIYRKRIKKDLWELNQLQQSSSAIAELIECLVDRPGRPIISMDKKIGIFSQAVRENNIHSSKVALLAKRLGLPEEETKELIAMQDECGTHNT